MSRKKNPKQYALDSSRGQAGIERAEQLALGGQQAQVWRAAGMKASVTTDRKKRASRLACRGRVHR
jgi:hypothetical protein